MSASVQISITISFLTLLKSFYQVIAFVRGSVFPRLSGEGCSSIVAFLEGNSSEERHFDNTDAKKGRFFLPKRHKTLKIYISSNT